MDLPAINASLNAVATVLLTSGFVLIKTGHRRAHQACMVSALAMSALFLVGYVANRVIVQSVHTTFAGEGFIRWVYYPMLISHILLAMVIVPLVLRTVWLAARGDFDRHRGWARITFPLWFYVSVTGVLVYLFLYQWFPSQAGG